MTSTSRPRGISEDFSDTDLQQVKQILESIGTMACILDQHLANATCAGSNSTAIMNPLANQIGYLADLGITKISGAPDLRGGAEEWLLPPSYFWPLEEKAEGAQQ